MNPLMHSPLARTSGLVCMLLGLSGLAVAQTNQDMDLGYDVWLGKTNKIARIHSSSPAWVYVIYEGNSGGRKIPRQNLPPELRSRFPYDPAAEEQYAREQKSIASRQTSTAVGEAAKGRQIINDLADAKLAAEEKRLMNVIAGQQKQDAALAQEVTRLRKSPSGRGRHARAAQLEEQLQRLRDQTAREKAALADVRKQREKTGRSSAAVQREIADLQKRLSEVDKGLAGLAGTSTGHGRKYQEQQLKAERKELQSRLKQLQTQVGP